MVAFVTHLCHIIGSNSNRIKLKLKNKGILLENAKSDRAHDNSFWEPHGK